MFLMRSSLKILASLLLISPVAIAVEVDSQQMNQQEAAAINYYAVGQYRQAIRLWKSLLQNNPEVKAEKALEISNLIASAQENLGYPREACSTLQNAIDANPYLCDLEPRQNPQITNLSLSSKNEVIAVITIANLQRDFGNDQLAKVLLNLSLRRAHELNDRRLIAGARLSLADLSFMELRLKRDRSAYRNLKLTDNEIVETEELFAQAYQIYEEAFDSPLERDAISKWLRLHEEHLKFQPFLSTSTLLRTKYEQYRPVLDKFLSLNIIEATEAQQAKYELDLAQRVYEFGLLHNDPSILNKAFDVSTNALNLSAKIGNDTLISESFGLLGKLYKLSGQNDDSLKAFKRASRRAQGNPNQYEWGYEIAKTLKEQGENEQAATYFESAIDNLKKVEWNVSPLSSELRINFQEQAAPVFDDYIDMLLSAQNPDFQKVLSVQRKFAASELQNYLGCGTLQPISVDQIFENDADAIVINIFESGNEYYTIIESLDGNITQARQINATNIKANLRKTRSLLDTAPNEKVFILNESLNQLYEQLITPIEAQLKSGKTLVFALDPSFQQIPVGMFFDGSQYLIEKHPVALIPPQLNQPASVDSGTKDNIFFAGLSQTRSLDGQQFSSLPYVEVEAKAIEADKKILNQDFTQDRLIEQLAKNIPIFHVATHGQFSSDPEQTFILAWDNKITLNSLTSIVGYRSQNTPSPIDLLVLSACETAKGDPLAALGLAGITVQAGTSSTLASLWRSDDLSSALIMEDFYQFWRAGNSKAKALQLAQIEQIEQGRSPYNWGNFVLIGSWL